MKRLTQEDFVNKANSIHNNLYDYSLSEYKTAHIKVKIICKIHGVFEQSPCNHFSGRGCPECGASSGITTEDFIKRAKEVHGDRFDYSKTKYVKAQDYTIIGCNIHGYFKQKPSEHLNGKGCYKCSGKMLKTTEQFIKEASSLHENFYNYSLVDYKGQRKFIDIICPIHGEFKQKPFNHLQGRGCPDCFNGGYSTIRTGYFYINYCFCEGGEDYIKFGITNNFSKRIRQFICINKLEDLANLNTFAGDGFSIYELEKEIKTEFGRYKTRKEVPDGYSETITIQDYHKIINKIENFMKNTNITEI